MLNISKALAVVAASYKLNIVCVNVMPVVSISKDLVHQGLSSKVAPIDAFKDLVQGIINLHRSEAV